LVPSFFFQAEDGIRDPLVTGVQTCALPIYAILADADKRAAYDRFGHAAVGSGAGPAGFDPSVFADFSDIFNDLFGFGDMFGGGRSEERRVGGGGCTRRCAGY